MKTSILTLASIVLLTSCTKSIQDKVVDYTKNQMKDPRSFELASVKVVDTLHKSDELYQIWEDNHYQREIYISKSGTALDLAEIWSGGSFPYKVNQYLDESKQALKQAEPYNKTCDSVTKVIASLENTPKDSVIGYKYYISAYAKNSFGARVLGQWYVITDPKGIKFQINEVESTAEEKIKHQIDVNEAKMSVF